MMLTRHNVIKSIWTFVNQGIQESKRILTGSDELIIDECNNAYKYWASAACSGNIAWLALPDNRDILSWSGNIWEPTRGHIEEASISATKGLQVSWDGIILIGQTGEVVREAAWRKQSSNLRANTLGASDGSDARLNLVSIDENGGYKMTD